MLVYNFQTKTYAMLWCAYEARIYSYTRHTYFTVIQCRRRLQVKAKIITHTTHQKKNSHTGVRSNLQKSMGKDMFKAAKFSFFVVFFSSQVNLTFAWQLETVDKVLSFPHIKECMQILSVSIAETVSIMIFGFTNQ